MLALAGSGIGGISGAARVSAIRFNCRIEPRAAGCFDPDERHWLDRFKKLNFPLLIVAQGQLLTIFPVHFWSPPPTFEDKLTPLVWSSPTYLAHYGPSWFLLNHDIVSQTVESNNPANAAIPGSSSGSASNTNTWATGVLGRFNLKDAFNNDFGLEVSASNPTGALSAGTDSLMVAQTVNSQGLTDKGTLSVYIRPLSTNPYTLDLKFSFFSGATFTTPAALNVLLTSLDIDYSQRYNTKNTDFTSNSTYAGTDLTAVPAVTGYTGFSASGNSTFDNPDLRFPLPRPDSRS